MTYQNVLQHSEEDCGAACLATIAKHYKRNLNINRIREAVGTGQQGTTLLGLRQGAEILGLNARTLKASPEILNRMNEAPLPAIIHWMGYHWVVLYGQKSGKYVIADPAVGVRYLSKKELAEAWTNWVILLLEPDATRFFVQPEDKISGFGQFIQRVLPYKGIIAQAFIYALVLGLLSLASPFLIQILTDDVLVRGDIKLLNAVVIAVVVMNIVSSSLRLVQSNLIAHFAQRLELGLILEFGRQILRLPLSYYESRRSGEIVSRLRDIQEINQLVSQVISSLPASIFIAFVSLGFMIFYSWKLTLISLLIIPLMMLSTLIFQPTLRQKTRNLFASEAENQGVLVESFKGALTLKTTTAAPQFWEEFQSRFGTVANITFRTMQIGIINNTFSSFVSAIGGVSLLWFGSNLVIANEISIGQLLAFNGMAENVLNLVTELVRFNDELIRVKTATQRLTEVINATPENQGDTKKPFAKIPEKSNIICTNLNFHHAGRVDLLEDFSVAIPGGKVTALIGKSGCGKSTLSKLIAGLYPPQSGNIRIGIYNLEDLSLDCLRQQVILVPQEAHFWSRSILENFRLGSPNVTFEEIVIACQIAGADDFISKLPDKYQTVLGEFGANISGGQRQRLAIARAIVNKPPVLILDESTAGLDPVSEAEVLDKVLFYRQGKTTILISHRPRVINRADWIVLLDQGKLKIQASLKKLRHEPGEHLDFLNP
ncbi:peptidase domain-containing ABC transporter [Nostoc sp. 'Peltigera membranacea cyanobiont' 232]|uniref:peptidase domain-containing ABC transporter n=1 Tax=Nostoc sp. 'Peltigera membranacea cyanobiont' 232 TaxID=2014531 RepID=UPI000B950888|nr:peptidase domain-containing ABC transporter [Nostoc sp. 'Peltigera membranacea cyanobiont' 232]OYE04379.1 ABC transporter ATP-binding protein [Nostoc sp. 'Peltigera membranacea cyanobiont' 232]